MYICLPVKLIWCMKFLMGVISNDPIFFVDETIDNICSKHPELIMKTSNDCHTYYNCSGEDPELSRWIPMYHFWPSKYKHECHYPFVFSTKSLRCENYTDVDCGSRFLPTWACKYDRWHYNAYQRCLLQIWLHFQYIWVAI